MSALADNLAGRFLGPVFEKELRVSSRRRRYYVLRFGYVAALATFVAVEWASRFSGIESVGGIQQVAQMADAGKGIVADIAWFQFVALQALAVVLLSGAINGEVRQRTFVCLMTVPANRYKIVQGKLTSCLLQLALLLCISFPLLAIVRMLGGVPWWFVLSSTCVTLTAGLVVGALSLYASITSASPLGSIFRAILYYLLLFHLAPVATACCPLGAIGLALFVPSGVMFWNVNTMLHPTGGFEQWLWLVHCPLMLLAAWLILLQCASKLDKVARASGDGTIPRKLALGPPVIQHPMPTTHLPPLPKAGVLSPASLSTPLDVAAPGGAWIVPAVKAPPLPAAVRPLRDRPLRPVRGSALVWKELRFFTSGDRRKTAIGVSVMIGVLGLMYVCSALAHTLIDTHFTFLAIYMLAGTVVTVVLTPMTLTAEKQARALPVLLTTPVTDWGVIWSKALGVMLRSGAAWLLAIIHTLAFWALGPMTSAQAAATFAIIIYINLFALGLGLYISSRVQTSVVALTFQVVAVAAVWIILPAMLADLPWFNYRYPWLTGDLFNPWQQAAYALGAHDEADALSSGPPLPFRHDLLPSFLLFSGLGLCLIAMAKRRLRKDLF